MPSILNIIFGYNMVWSALWWKWPIKVRLGKVLHLCFNCLEWLKEGWMFSWASRWLLNIHTKLSIWKALVNEVKSETNKNHWCRGLTMPSCVIIYHVKTLKQEMMCKRYKDGFDLVLQVPKITIRKYLGVLAMLYISNEVQVDVSTVNYHQASCYYLCHTKR